MKTKRLSCANKKKAKKKLKDPMRPRRPLNAYNIFFSIERKKLIQEHQLKKDQSSDQVSAGVGFANMARTVSERWKAIDATQKREVEEMARLDNVRYKKEIDAWKLKLKVKAELRQLEAEVRLNTTVNESSMTMADDTEKCNVSIRSVQRSIESVSTENHDSMNFLHKQKLKTQDSSKERAERRIKSLHMQPYCARRSIPVQSMPTNNLAFENQSSFKEQADDLEPLPFQFSTASDLTPMGNSRGTRNASLSPNNSQHDRYDSSPSHLHACAPCNDNNGVSSSYASNEDWGVGVFTSEYSCDPYNPAFDQGSVKCAMPVTNREPGRICSAPASDSLFGRRRSMPTMNTGDGIPIAMNMHTMANAVDHSRTYTNFRYSCPDSDVGQSQHEPSMHELRKFFGLEN